VLVEVFEDAGADATNLTLCSMRAAQGYTAEQYPQF
jgi:hypothetical protein